MANRKKVCDGKEDVGRRICEVRVALGLSVKDLATAAGIHYNHLYLLEKGAYFPKSPTLRKLAKRLGVSVDWLLTGEGQGPVSL